MAVMCYLEDDNLSQRSYIRPIFARRKEQGDFYHLVRELELADRRGSAARWPTNSTLYKQLNFWTSQINLSSVFSIVFFERVSCWGMTWLLLIGWIASVCKRTL